jgi:nicotinamide-nucleotide amidase
LTAEIITVGSELLIGGGRNTNFSEVCARLGEIGVEVAFGTTVGDIESRIALAVTTALSRSEVVILTGGLGPTHDDVTREALAAATGRRLTFSEELRAEIERFFERRQRRMSEPNLRQAYLPDGAVAISNPTGTAPGFEIEHNGGIIFALPGVPSEMSSMLQVHVIPRLAERTNGAFVLRTLKVAGLGESDLAARIRGTVESCAASGNPSITVLSGPGEVVLQIRAAGANRKTATDRIHPVEEELRRALGNRVYGADADTLESVVSAILRQQELSLGVAESFTGGALTSRIVAVPGASSFLRAAYVTYAADAKVGELGVPPEILERHGVVSAETARSMAEQVRLRAESDLGLSTTGEAGPLPDEEPVGTMFIGLAWQGGSLAERFLAGGGRDDIRAWGANAAMNLLRLWLLDQRQG